MRISDWSSDVCSSDLCCAAFDSRAKRWQFFLPVGADSLYRRRMQIHPLIESSTALTEFCDLIKDSAFLAVDTEFMRENTSWPELCLIPVADSHHAAANDPLASSIDLRPRLDLLVAHEQVLHVFHDGRPNVEIQPKK